MLAPWRTGTVIKIEAATANTKRFWLQVNEIENFDFKPGQFITLDLPIHEKRNKRWRSYSISSAPDGANIIELVVSLFQDGLGTNYLFNEVKEGSEILLRGPQGVFTLPEKLDTDIFFICTGTGIAPFRSMVWDIYHKQIPHKNIYLIFGCRFIKDTLYGDELKALESKLNNFYWLPTFSREPTNNSLIRTGYVHKVYEEIIAKNKCEANFYLCGWKNMIDEAKQKITALGCDKKNIHFELYG